jgi:hypothetical protein
MRNDDLDRLGSAAYYCHPPDESINHLALPMTLSYQENLWSIFVQDFEFIHIFMSLTGFLETGIINIEGCRFRLVHTQKFALLTSFGPNILHLPTADLLFLLVLNGCTTRRE